MVGDSNAVYIISRKTKAIMTQDSPYYRSRILEIGQEKQSVHSPEQIIDHSCILYGATLKGRRDSAKKRLKLNNKVPVPVIPEAYVYMLPTCSSRSKENVWLSICQIKQFDQEDNGTYVTFYDGTGLYVSTSESSLDMQYKRTSELMVKLNWRCFFGNDFFFPEDFR